MNGFSKNNEWLQVAQQRYPTVSLISDRSELILLIDNISDFLTTTPHVTENLSNFICAEHCKNYKVQILWEGHKIWKKLTLYF